MKKTLLYFVLLISLCSYADATDTKPNLTSLRVGAEKGDAHSQLEYGKAIHNTSREEAGIWIQKAADQGLGEAWFWLGYAGLGKEPSVFYYKKAAEKGYPEAYDYLLDELLFRAGSSADVTEAKKFADLARKFNIKIYGVDSKLETIDRCYEAGSATVPASDQPTTDEIKAFKLSYTDCSSFQIGDGTEKNWDSYRKCLLSQDGIDNNDLAEIYANGWGVKRNPKLAIALVCHGSFVPAELEGMVEALYSTKDKVHLKEDFYFCNYVTSGMNGGFCAVKAEANAWKKKKIRTLSSYLSMDSTTEKGFSFSKKSRH